MLQINSFVFHFIALFHEILITKVITHKLLNFIIKILPKHFCGSTSFHFTFSAKKSNQKLFVKNEIALFILDVVRDENCFMINAGWIVVHLNRNEVIASYYSLVGSKALDIRNTHYF